MPRLFAVLALLSLTAAPALAADGGGSDGGGSDGGGSDGGGSDGGSQDGGGNDDGGGSDGGGSDDGGSDGGSSSDGGGSDGGAEQNCPDCVGASDLADEDGGCDTFSESGLAFLFGLGGLAGLRRRREDQPSD